MLVHHWSHPTTPAGPGWDTVISNAVQLVDEKGFAAKAALGEAEKITLLVDDPLGVYDFKRGHRWYMIETETDGQQLVWNGYISDQSMNDGTGTGTVFPDGVGRRWTLEIDQENTILGFRAISGSDGNRPAETPGERLAWLLASSYLSTVVDHGLIDWALLNGLPDMDAVDYRGRKADDVLKGIAEVALVNYYCRYRDATSDLEFAMYEPNTSTLDSSTLRISNDPADLGATTWACEPGATLRRMGSRVAAGMLVPFGDGQYVYGYNLDTSYEFGFIDQVAPAADVKTTAKAAALRDDLLVQHSEQDERIERVRLILPAANLNDVRHGQRIQFRQTHLAGYESLRWCRVVSKSFSRVEGESQQVWAVDLELSPQPTTVSTFARVSRPNDNEVLGSEARFRWDYDGDNPAAGTQAQPAYGLASYYPTPKPGIGWQGIRIDGEGDVDILLVANFAAVVSGDCTATFEIRLNGTTVVGSEVVTRSGGLGGWSPGCWFTASQVHVRNGDIVEGWVRVEPLFGITIPAGTGDATHQLTVTGDLFAP